MFDTQVGRQRLTFRKRFVTQCARVGFFARVCVHVGYQSPLLRKRFVAQRARVGFFTHVRRQMTPTLNLSIRIGFFTRVCAHVCLQKPILRKRFVAFGAMVGFIITNYSGISHDKKREKNETFFCFNLLICVREKKGKKILKK